MGSIEKNLNQRVLGIKQLNTGLVNAESKVKQYELLILQLTSGRPGTLSDQESDQLEKIKNLLAEAEKQAETIRGEIDFLDPSNW